MSTTIPRCYDAQTGQPATVSNKNDIIYPRQREGVTQPTPAKGAANVFEAIAAVPPQKGLL